ALPIYAHPKRDPACTRGLSGCQSDCKRGSRCAGRETATRPPGRAHGGLSPGACARRPGVARPCTLDARFGAGAHADCGRSTRSTPHRVPDRSGLTRSDGDDRLASRLAAAGATQSIPDSSVAIPRKLAKPTMSVTVVRMIDEDCAGSCPIIVSIVGTSTPQIPAAILERTMEAPITSASPADLLHAYPPTAVVRETSIPLSNAPLASMRATRGHWPMRISRMARPRL